MSIPSLVKRAGETMLCRAGAAQVARDFNRDKVIVLSYHNIVPTGERCSGDYSLHLSQHEFAKQLDRLGRTHEIVSLDDLGATSRRPRAVITFDDAYQGAITAGVEELQRRGLPATVFVAPDLLNGRSFWWDVLADPTQGLSPGLRTTGLEQLKGQDKRIRRWAEDRRLRINEVPVHQTGATFSQLQSAGNVAGITLGSHTWSHPNLAALDESGLYDELARPLLWLRERFQPVVPWIAYPYGLSTELVERAARDAGYVGGFRVTGGWWSGMLETRLDFSIPRVNIPAGASLKSFELRSCGLLKR